MAFSLARRAAHFGLRANQEVKKETLFLLCSFANRHNNLLLLASASLKENWTWFKLKYDFEAWLCAAWVGWVDGRLQAERVLRLRSRLQMEKYAAAVIPAKGASFNVLANDYVNGTLQSEVLVELGHIPHQTPYEWWQALQAELSSRLPSSLPLEFKRNGSLTSKSVNRCYFLTHVVLLICRYGRAVVGKPVQLPDSTMDLLAATLNNYLEQTGRHARVNEEVFWELCSALQCLGVESPLVMKEQRAITSRFAGVEVQPDSRALSSDYQEMHFHFLAGVLVAGPSRVVG